MISETLEVLDTLDNEHLEKIKRIISGTESQHAKNRRADMRRQNVKVSHDLCDTDEEEDNTNETGNDIALVITGNNLNKLHPSS